ncbi:MAG: hypothetical protein K2X81_24850, partial [Candidatus Obscuribacterales bacterium]|nr:hypothetical protein [Candidatus Obscuribacterales bacterium]
FQSLSFLAPVKSSSDVLIHNLASLGLDWIRILWALIVLPVGIFLLKNLKGLQRFPFILLVISIALFCYSMGIPASNINHLMAAFMALSWCLAICFDYMPFWIPISGLICCALSFPHLCDEARYRPLILPHAIRAASRLQNEALRDKDVLTDDVFINVISDSNPVLVDCATFLNVWSAKGSDFSQLIKPIEEKKYAAIIINTEDAEMKKFPPNFWPRPVVLSVIKNYKLKDQLHCSGWGLNMYVPLSQAQK